MFMSTFKAGTMISEQKRAGHKCRRSGTAAILEGAVCHGGDRIAVVLFGEAPVARPAVAHDIVDAPATPGCKDIRCNRHGRYVSLLQMPRKASRNFSNFSQAGSDAPH
jgi:hypothetical protein